ncbi:ty3-gypsy retrotransposon protein [Tanacetum coccineum]
MRWKKLAQQQAADFQVLLDTLRIELQATCGVPQGRQRGGSDQGALLTRSMRLDRLRIVSFNLEGTTAEWFQWLSWNGLITTWDRFEESVKNRFGPSKYEDPKGVLSKLLQLDMVEDYQREFEKLMNRVTDC